MVFQKVNKRKLASSIDFSRSPEYKKGIRSIIMLEFERIKAKIISEFNNHKVTQEIEMGPNANNISGTLGGYGNLFSYIGFESSDKPTEPIRQALNSIAINSITFNKLGVAQTIISYPKPVDIFGITPLPWANGRSWAEGIERGLPGLGYFLSKDDAGRSGGGLQVTSKVKSGVKFARKFQNTKYISSLIKDFEKDIYKLNSQTF